MNTPALAAIGTALCDTGRRIDVWSRLLTGLALLACALPVPAGGWLFLVAGIFLAGIAQLFYALRTGFERAIFALWASLPEDALPSALTAFDRALVEVGLAKSCAERPLTERVAGVRRLVQRQLLALAVQVAGTAAFAGFLLLH
jgi:hypothetical protein